MTCSSYVCEIRPGEIILSNDWPYGNLVSLILFSKIHEKSCSHSWTLSLAPKWNLCISWSVSKIEIPEPKSCSRMLLQWNCLFPSIPTEFVGHLLKNWPGSPFIWWAKKKILLHGCLPGYNLQRCAHQVSLFFSEALSLSPFFFITPFCSTPYLLFRVCSA